jgi:hypothetical protein
MAGAIEDYSKLEVGRAVRVLQAEGVSERDSSHVLCACGQNVFSRKKLCGAINLKMALNDGQRQTKDLAN